MSLSLSEREIDILLEESNFRVHILFDFNTIKSTKFILDENLKYWNAICTFFRENIETRDAQSAFILLAECEINNNQIERLNLDGKCNQCTAILRIILLSF